MSEGRQYTGNVPAPAAYGDNTQVIYHDQYGGASAPPASNSAPYALGSDAGDNKSSIQSFFKRNSSILIPVIIVVALVIIGIIVFVAIDASDSNSASSSSSSSSSSSGTITINIQSANTKEKWMETMVTEFESSSYSIVNGKQVKINLYNTGSTFRSEYEPDIWSPANSQFIRLQEEEDNTVYVSDESTLCTQVTNIPVGVAMWRSMAEQLGWPNQNISFADIGELSIHPRGWKSINPALSWDDFKYGHGHPAESNSGRLSFVATIFAFSNATYEEGLSLGDVYAAETDPDVIAIEQAVYHLGKIDTDLLERMLIHGQTYLHAVANYESNVVNWNIDNATELAAHGDDWVFIYLTDGTFWMTHPLCTLDSADWSTEEKVNASLAFTEFATLDENAELLLQYGIRPYSGNIDITCCNSTIKEEYGVDPSQNIETTPIITYPDDDVMAAAIEVWHNVKKTAAFALVIDTSGSMGTIDDGYEYNRLTYAKEAIINFINSTDDQDYLLGYGFQSTYSSPGYVRDEADNMITWVQSLDKNGVTPLWGTMQTAYNDLFALKNQNEAMNISWNYGIVAMTDGDPTDEAKFTGLCYDVANETDIDPSICDGADIDEYALSPDIIHFFPIVFGDQADAATTELELLADLSSGAYYEADNDDLEDVYFLISLEL